MNPQEFLNNAVLKIMGLINPAVTRPGSSEQQIVSDYFGALSNPVGFIEQTQAVADKIKRRNAALEDAIKSTRGY